VLGPDEDHRILVWVFSTLSNDYMTVETPMNGDCRLVPHSNFLVVMVPIKVDPLIGSEHSSRFREQIAFDFRPLGPCQVRAVFIFVHDFTSRSCVGFRGGAPNTAGEPGVEISLSVFAKTADLEEGRVSVAADTATSLKRAN
jgi:hypothetical protein